MLEDFKNAESTVAKKKGNDADSRPRCRGTKPGIRQLAGQYVQGNKDDQFVAWSEGNSRQNLQHLGGHHEEAETGDNGYVMKQFGITVWLSGLK